MENLEKEIDRVELTWAGNALDALSAEEWKEYRYGDVVPGGSSILSWEAVKAISNELGGGFQNTSYFIRAWIGNYPFISRRSRPLSRGSLPSAGLLTVDRNKIPMIAREIFGTVRFFRGDPDEGFNDFIPPAELTEDEFFDEAFTARKASHERLDASQHPAEADWKNDAEWKMYEFRDMYLDLRTSLIWINNDLRGVKEEGIRETYGQLKDKLSEMLRIDGAPRTLRNSWKELHYLIEEHERNLRLIAAGQKAGLRRTSDAIINLMSEVRYSFGRRTKNFEFEADFIG